MPADLAEKLSDLADALPVEKYRKQAREDLVERLLAGEKVGRFWLRDVLDCALNDNYMAVIHSLAEDFSGLESDGEYARVERMESLCGWLRRQVEYFVDSQPKMIEDRAETLAEESEENV